jgi:hypothetical protein
VQHCLSRSNVWMLIFCFLALPSACGANRPYLREVFKFMFDQSQIFPGTLGKSRSMSPPI